MNQNSVYNISKGKKSAESIIETAIFELAVKGDSDALGTIYDLYFDDIFRFIYYRTSHQETAEDLAEDVFIKAFRNLSTVKGGAEKLRSWIYQIARNSVIDHYRKNQAVLPIEEVETLAQYDNTILDTLQLASNQQLLVSAIGKLLPEHQTVIKLRFLEELEISEIAQLLNKSEGNIRIIQYRALQKLRSFLEKSSTI